MDKVELAGSLVAKCWSTFVDESEKIVKMVKENADFLATTTLDMLNNLFTEMNNFQGSGWRLRVRFSYLFSFLS